MPFKDDAQIYFELEPFEPISGTDNPIIPSENRGHQSAHEIRIEDDEWVGKMCGRDADEFLSSIQKSGKLSRAAKSSIELHRKTDDGRDDIANRQTLIPSTGRNKRISSGSNDQRDGDLNVHRLIIAEKRIEKKYKEVNKLILDGCTTRAQVPRFASIPMENSASLNFDARKNFRSCSTEGGTRQAEAAGKTVQKSKYFTRSIERGGSDISAQTNKNCIVSSSRSHAKMPRKKCASSTDSSERSSDSRRNAISSIGVQKYGKLWDRPSPSTKLILDDLIDLRENIESDVGKGLGRKGGATYSERALPTLLRENEWERARQHLRRHPDEARQKIINMALEENSEIYSTFPLHLACAVRPLPPTELIQDLVNAYPEACQHFEEPSGLLPIHIVCNLLPAVVEEDASNANKMQQSSEESPNHEGVVDLLLSSYPYSISVAETINSMTPLHIAASTTRAENGIISPIASNVLNTLMVKSPFDAVYTWKDKNGMTPYDWAWRNVDYFCPHCGNESSTDANDDCNGCTKCHNSLSVSEKCLHPFLRKEICNHGFQQNESIIPPQELNRIRECANANMASRKMNCNKDALGIGKSATLHMNICVSELVHPSNHGKRRKKGLSGKVVPNPFLEVFSAHRRGMSKSYYKSYPIRGSTEGTWEDAFLDLGLTPKQLQNGTNGAGYIEVGIRVMHCPENGKKIKLIGTCQVSLDTLKKQQAERLKLQNEIRNLQDIIGDGKEVQMALPEPEKYPLLKGFEVTGKLQVMSLTIE